ncbi:hypothetical protein HAX54_038222 [Datura stramonium]|uniref:Helicase C-terminal domain-containing protein n=1 Tax=Datura stramonium TaxID=4076 RepID=A0ABS8RMT7_DATST|nr:hypothetical protein [Datura stramonium]
MFIEASDNDVFSHNAGWILKITKKFLKNPLHIDLVGDSDQKLADGISLFSIACEMRKPAFLRLITEHAKGGKCIVFTQTKRFRQGQFNVLVATDVAARGLDVPNVDLVVHYELPNSSEIFVHRSGRTGRAGKKGSAILIYSSSQHRDVKEVVAALALMEAWEVVDLVIRVQVALEILAAGLGARRIFLVETGGFGGSGYRRSGGSFGGPSSGRSGNFGGWGDMRESNRQGGFGNFGGSDRSGGFGSSNRTGGFGNSESSNRSTGFGGFGSGSSGLVIQTVLMALEMARLVVTKVLGRKFSSSFCVDTVNMAIGNDHEETNARVMSNF